MNRKILTFSGKLFDWQHPTVDMICIEDIAHALSLINRYTGHTRLPYSVAEHCVRASYVTSGDALVNLLHDAAEAYVGDIASPQKRALCWKQSGQYISPQYTSFKQQEIKILEVIAQALDVPSLAKGANTGGTKEADLIMLATEVRDLMPTDTKGIFIPWLQGVQPLPIKIAPWNWAIARSEFLKRYEELHG